MASPTSDLQFEVESRIHKECQAKLDASEVSLLRDLVVSSEQAPSSEIQCESLSRDLSSFFFSRDDLQAVFLGHTDVILNQAYYRRLHSLLKKIEKLPMESKIKTKTFAIESLHLAEKALTEVAPEAFVIYENGLKESISKECEKYQRQDAIDFNDSRVWREVARLRDGDVPSLFSCAGISKSPHAYSASVLFSIEMAKEAFLEKFFVTASEALLDKIESDPEMVSLEWKQSSFETKIKYLNSYLESNYSNSIELLGINKAIAIGYLKGIEKHLETL